MVVVLIYPIFFKNCIKIGLLSLQNNLYIWTLEEDTQVISFLKIKSNAIDSAETESVINI